MNSRNEHDLTNQEKYDIEYAKGYRIGRISASRDSAIQIIKLFGKPSRELLHKINDEVDRRILMEIILRVADKSFTVEELETTYDDIVPPEYQTRKNTSGKNRKES